MLLLASAEAQLPKGTRFVNQALLKKFADRSLESIKGIRNKHPRYKSILVETREKLEAIPRARTLPSTPISLAAAALDGYNKSDTPIKARTPLGARRSSRLRRELPTPPPMNITNIEDTTSDILEDLPLSAITMDETFKKAIRNTYNCNIELKEICEEGFELTLNYEKFDEFIRKNHTKSTTSNRRPGNSDTSKYRRKIKLRRYARFQQMYRKKQEKSSRHDH